MRCVILLCLCHGSSADTRQRLCAGHVPSARCRLPELSAVAYSQDLAHKSTVLLLSDCFLLSLDSSVLQQFLITFASCLFDPEHPTLHECPFGTVYCDQAV